MKPNILHWILGIGLPSYYCSHQSGFYPQADVSGPTGRYNVLLCIATNIIFVFIRASSCE